jgi:peroxiredoxin
MSQAEIAGGRLTRPDELPTRGQRLPDFEFVSADGASVRLSDYRGRSNLVLLFTQDDQCTAELLSAVASRYQEIKAEDAQVLAVAPTPADGRRWQRQLALPYSVVADPQSKVYPRVGAINSQGQPAAALYVTDRFGEIFAVYRTRDGQPLPAVADVLNWLEFVNSQCPECEPPEWPV